MHSMHIEDENSSYFKTNEYIFLFYYNRTGYILIVLLYYSSNYRGTTIVVGNCSNSSN